MIIGPGKWGILIKRVLGLFDFQVKKVRNWVGNGEAVGEEFVSEKL